MQRAIREEHVKVMDSKDQEKFSGLHKDGKLLRAEQPGNVIAKLVLEAPKSLGGQFLRYVQLKPRKLSLSFATLLIYY